MEGSLHKSTFQVVTKKKLFHFMPSNFSCDNWKCHWSTLWQYCMHSVLNPYEATTQLNLFTVVESYSTQWWWQPAGGTGVGGVWTKVNNVFLIVLALVTQRNENLKVFQLQGKTSRTEREFGLSFLACCLTATSFCFKKMLKESKNIVCCALF